MEGRGQREGAAGAAGLVDRLLRRAGPRLLAASARVKLPARLAASARRTAGGRGRLELFFALDDPCRAVAGTGLVLAGLERGGAAPAPGAQPEPPA